MTSDLRMTVLKAQNQDKEAMSKLIDENVGLIWNIVQKFKYRGYEQEDLFQIGCEGFIKAIRNFNFEFNTELSTYLVPVIMGEIKRFIRDDGMIKISRSIKELSYKIYILKEEYSKKGIDITVDELSRKLEVTVEDIVEAIDSNVRMEYIENHIGNEDDGQIFLEKIGDNVCNEDEIVNNIFVKNILNKMNKRDRQIIILRYYKQKSQTEISKMLGISQVQVSRIEKKIISKIREENYEAIVNLQ